MELIRKFLNDELKIKDDKVFNKFIFYNELLLDWNSKINLISRSSISIEAQVLNSIFFLTKYEIKNNSCIIDIGTGGGFPSIPLKILQNDIELVLADSIYKKINAVSDIIKKLEFKKIKAICERVETISKEPSYIKKFDIVTAKSVTTLDKLYNWTKSFLKENGKMVFIKGGNITEEIKLLKKKNNKLSVEVIEYKFDEVYKIEDKKIVIIKL
jgi:16S rRNA (guanine527-N7)-methyltransferase